MKPERKRVIRFYRPIAQIEQKHILFFFMFFILMKLCCYSFQRNLMKKYFYQIIPLKI